METKIELERRWLLKGCPGWVQDNCTSDVMIDQFYTPDGWRYRKIEDLITYKSTYERTMKTSVERGVNHEKGTENIKKKDYLKAQHDAIKKISKNRMTIICDGRTFEVDNFYGCNLTIVEVEGVTMHDTIVFPEVIEKDVLMEVTGNPKFSNFSLADDITEEEEDEEGNHDNDDDDDDDND